MACLLGTLLDCLLHVRHKHALYIATAAGGALGIKRTTGQRHCRATQNPQKPLSLPHVRCCATTDACRSTHQLTVQA